MDAKDFGHSQSGERESRVLFGRRKRGALPIACSSDCQRRARDREPHLLSSEPGALLAGAYPARAECHSAFARNNNRSRDYIVPPALRGGYRPDATERIDPAENRRRPQLSRGPGEHRPAGLGEARSGHHSAARETATARWQRYFTARRGRRSLADGGSPSAHFGLVAYAR